MTNKNVSKIDLDQSRSGMFLPNLKMRGETVHKQSTYSNCKTRNNVVIQSKSLLDRSTSIVKRFQHKVKKVTPIKLVEATRDTQRLRVNNIFITDEKRRKGPGATVN
jgi:hypothetical protein